MDGLVCCGLCNYALDRRGYLLSRNIRHPSRDVSNCNNLDDIITRKRLPADHALRHPLILLNLTDAIHEEWEEVQFLHTTTLSQQPQPTRAYNWPSLVLLSCIALVALCGNVLVCLAVCCKRKLQSMFNCFLVSLALSDMMSAILVMPLSILRTSVEPLPLPKFVCVAWYCLDVLFTSSTICHLCMISIDRYLTLTFPLRYGRTRSRKKQTIAKLAVVWVISMSIAGPLFILNMMDSSYGEDELAVYKGCGPENPTFVISSTVISFYLPLLIMTVMYALTVRALQQQLKEQRRIAVTNSVASSSISGPSSSRGGLTRSKSDRRPWRSLRVKYDSGSQSEKILSSKTSTIPGRKAEQTRQIFGSISKEASNDSAFKRWAKKVYDMRSKKSAVPDRSNIECLPNLEELLGTSEYSSLANASINIERHEFSDGKSLECYIPIDVETSRFNIDRAIKMDYSRMGLTGEDRKEFTSPESLRAVEMCTPTAKSSSMTSESVADRSIMSLSLIGINPNDNHPSETTDSIQKQIASEAAQSSELVESLPGSLSDATNDRHEDAIITISNSKNADLGSSNALSITSLENSKEFSLKDPILDTISTKKPAIIYDIPDLELSQISSTKRQVPKSGSSKSGSKQDRSKWKNTKSKNSTSRDIVTPIITVDLADESPASADSSDCYNVALDISMYAVNCATVKDGETSTQNNSFETTTFITSPAKSLNEHEQMETDSINSQIRQKGIQKFPPIKQLSLPLKRISNSNNNNNNKYLNTDQEGICLSPSKLLSSEGLREGDEGASCTLSVPELSSIKIRHHTSNNSLLDINYNSRLPTQRQDANRRLTSTSLGTFNTPLRHRLSAVSASFGFRPSVCSTGSAGRYGLGCPDKGRRAVQVLGILFAVFVVCYLPFFGVYLVNTTCIRCREYISSRTLAALEWLGYTGSLLNPIIYHIFSPDFRLAFHDLIRCRCCCRQKKRKHFLSNTCASKNDTTRCSLAGKCRKSFCFSCNGYRSHRVTKSKQLPASTTSSEQADFRPSTRSQTNVS